jgi:hypothetical protein
LRRRSGAGGHGVSQGAKAKSPAYIDGRVPALLLREGQAIKVTF